MSKKRIISRGEQESVEEASNYIASLVDPLGLEEAKSLINGLCAYLLIIEPAILLEILVSLRAQKDAVRKNHIENVERANEFVTALAFKDTNKKEIDDMVVQYTKEVELIKKARKAERN